MMLSSLLIARSGLVLKVRSSQPSDLRWLEECLRPGFSVVTDGRYDWEILVQVDGFRYRQLQDGGSATGRPVVPVFSFDSEVGEYPVWNGEPLTIHDREFRLFYRVCSAEKLVEVVTAAPLPSLRVALLRLVREISTQHLVRRGQIQFHGAVVSLAGQGLMICGPKRAGKTSLTIHLLQDPAARFLSNDRALVELGAQPPAMVSGMPTVIAIRPGALTLFPDLPLSQIRHWRARQTLVESLNLVSHAASGPQPAKLDMNPEQFCHFLGTAAVAVAPLRAVLFPRVNPQQPHVEITRLDMAEISGRLLTNLLLPGYSVITSSMGESWSLDLVRKRVNQIAAEILGLEIVLGEGAYLDRTAAARVLERLGL